MGRDPVFDVLYRHCDGGPDVAKRRGSRSGESVQEVRFLAAGDTATQSPHALEHIFGSIIEAHGGRQSAPNRRIGTFGLVVVATCAFSLGIAV
jgi:hypothetical protein